MNEYDINPASIKRREFFRAKNLSDPPIEALERYEAAVSYLKAVPPQYDLVLALYDQVEDHFNPKFQMLCGNIYAVSESAYYDRSRARSYFKRAFRLFDEDKEKIDAAESYLEQYVDEFINIPEGFFDIANDETAFNALVYLSQNGIEPKIFGKSKEERASPYFLAACLGAGHGVNQNHTEAQNYYRAYLTEVNKGHLDHAFRNVALRLALGLGEAQNFQKASQLARTGSIIFERRPYGTSDSLTITLTKLWENSKEPDYLISHQSVVRQFQNKLIPWSMLEIISQAKTSSKLSKEAIVDTISLICLLSRAEKWPDHERWRQMYRYATKTFFPDRSLDLDVINPSFRLGHTVRFHPQIISQEPDRLGIRISRLKMYEYFRDKNLGIPPILQKDRYELALKFKNHTPKNYDASLVLFDEDEDSQNADWLFLAGSIHNLPHAGHHNKKMAFSYFKRASDLGHGEASYQVALEYEKGEIVPFNLDTAWKYFEKATQQGCVVLSPIYERVKRVITELDELSTSSSVRQKIFSLYSFYRDNRLGEVPIKSLDRYKRHYEFTQKIPPQYNNAYALFIEEIDGDDADWLAAAAFILDQHLNNESLFNPQKAQAFNIRATELGSSMAAFNLAVKYHVGQEMEIDLDKALKWYRKADELGSRSAKHRIANILKFERELNGLSINDAHTDEIVQLYEDGCKNEDLVAGLNYAELFINGIKKKRDPKFSISIYDWILTKSPSHSEQSSHAKVAFRMAVRSFLGLDVEKNNKKALHYLDNIPDQSNHSHIRYYMQEIKQSLRKHIASEVISKNNDLELIQRLYANPEEIQETIRKIDSGFIKVREKLVNYIRWAEWLANNESWPSQYDWSDLAESVQAHQLKFSFSQAVKSTKDSGPRYNLLDERGLPILGILIKPSANDKEEDQQRVTTGSYVPQPGLIRLNSIQGNPDGFIYAGHYSEHLPAMLTQEDIQVSEILVFGDPKKGPLFPSLSLETQNNDEYGKGSKGSGYDKAFTYKIFSPQWVAYTDFGRTLWITDYLIGQWCWNPEKYQIGLPEECASRELHYMAKEFIRDLRLTGGRDGGASSARVMIQPKSNYILPEPPQTVYQQANAFVAIKEMTMKVYGSYILNDGNTENRSLFEEDPNFAQGRTVKKLTDRYNDIMKLDPRFERAQQLMGLFYGHFRLWEIGYRPSHTLQEELSAKLKAMESLGRERDEKLLVRRSFGLRPY